MLFAYIHNYFRKTHTHEENNNYDSIMSVFTTACPLIFKQ